LYTKVSSSSSFFVLREEGSELGRNGHVDVPMMLRVQDAIQPFDVWRICLLITTLHSVVTQITPSSLAIIKFLKGRSQYCTTSGVPPPWLVSGVFFFSMDRAVRPFLDELGSTCAVTCLAESQPNGLFVITPVSFSLLSVSEVRLYFNKELSCPHYFNKEPSCPLSISTKNTRVRSLGTLGGFPLYGQD
jgi:hypothetical protein